MQDGMLSGLFGALTTEHRMNFIANNLANVNTTGYKRDTVAFKDTMASYAHDEIREPLMTVRSKPLFPEPKNMVRPRVAVSQVDFSQGSMHATGNPLDLAIAGDGFFKINTPGGTYYTRDGHFVLSGDGTLMTPQGWTVQSDGGQITIPQGTRHVMISEDGQVFADEEQMGTIDVVTVDDLTKMEKYGRNLYRPRPGSDVAEQNAFDGQTRLAQGFTEKANVEVVYEMVNMIETNRLFEAYQKIIQSSDTMDRDAISRVGRRSS